MSLAIHRLTAIFLSLPSTTIRTWVCTIRTHRTRHHLSHMVGTNTGLHHNSNQRFQGPHHNLHHSRRKAAVATIDGDMIDKPFSFRKPNQTKPNLSVQVALEFESPS